MKTKERLITVGDAFAVLRRFLLLILAATVIGAALGYVYAAKNKSVHYEASSVVIVQMTTVDEVEGPDATDISRARAIAKSLEEEMSNDKLIANLRRYFAERRVDRPNEGWEDLSEIVYPESVLKSMISAHAEDSSQHLTITVNAPTPSLAVHLANAVAGELQASVVMDVGNCTIKPTDTATTATEHVAFSKRPIILAAGLGAVLTYALEFLYIFLDPRVQNSREVLGNYTENYPLLGTLPGEKRNKGGKRA